MKCENHRVRSVLAQALVAAGVLTGCGYQGASSIPLPFTAGGGAGAKVVTVDLADATGLTVNGEVFVNDVNVGHISKLGVNDWNPVATLTLDADVNLPANAVARVGQKSLLGAKYLELAVPAIGATGRLHSGETLQAAADGNYPATEQVLGSLSLVLNGGGLQQARSIATELNHALGSHVADARGFLTQFNTWISSLNAQRNNILDTVSEVASLAGTLKSSDVLAKAVDQLPTTFRVLGNDEKQLVNALTAVSRLGTTAKEVVTASGRQVLSNLSNVVPALRGLADAGGNLTQSLSVLPVFPFPSNTSFPRMFQGDYGNLFLTLDVSPAMLSRNLLYGFTLPSTSTTSSLLQAPPLGAGDHSVGLTLPNLPGLTKSLTGGLGQLSSPNSTGGLSSLVSGLLGGGSSR